MPYGISAREPHAETRNRSAEWTGDGV